MKRLFKCKIVTTTLLAGLLFGAGVASAEVIEVGPPEMEKGKVATYTRVKKNGHLWYPASVVGYYRKIQFAYDPATKILYANGDESVIEALMVDDVVYLNLAPTTTMKSMRPGMNSLALRRAQLKAMESTSSHMEGNTEALFFSEDVPEHAHPWANKDYHVEGPIINLDPTHEASEGVFMQPGVRPPEGLPEALPNRLPRPGERPAARQVETNHNGTVVIPATNSTETHVATQPVTSGVPVHVTSQGGPQIPDPTISGLEPIPKAPEKPVKADPFGSSGELRAAGGQNSVFKVTLNQGSWQRSAKDALLRVKLSQTNISRVAQSNLGVFSVRCADGSRVEASRTRSYLPDGTLDPGTRRDGNLVFRFQPGQQPQSLELVGAIGLTLDLQLR